MIFLQLFILLFLPALIIAQSICGPGLRPQLGADCLPCTTGTIKLAPGNFTCQTCPKNSVCADAQSFSCNAGYEPGNITTSDVVVFQCNACQSGYLKPEAGNTACKSASNSVGDFLNTIFELAKQNLVVAIVVGIFTVVILLVLVWYAWRRLKEFCSDFVPEKPNDEEAQKLDQKPLTSGRGSSGEFNGDTKVPNQPVPFVNRDADQRGGRNLLGRKRSSSVDRYNYKRRDKNLSRTFPHRRPFDRPRERPKSTANYYGRS